MKNEYHGYLLSRREMFAAMAMQGLLSDADRIIHPEKIAGYAVDYADALIAALDLAGPESAKGDA